VDTTLSGAVALYARLDFVDRSRVLRHPRTLIDFLAANVMGESYEANAALWDSASPIALVGRDAPPLLVAHGTPDSLIPMAEASAFVEALRAVAREPTAYAQIDGAQHAWDLFNTPWTDHTVAAVHAFASRVVARERLPRDRAG
jgi:acetyl esterase/lipase